MKKILLIAFIFTSCATSSREPKIQHADRTYRTCDAKETENSEKYACWRYCYKEWFKKRCKLILIERNSPQFNDFVLIHRSRLKG